MRRRLCCGAICGLVLVLPGAARGDGLPVHGVDAGPSGVTTAASGARHVALPAGRERTLVARVRKDGGKVLRSRVLRGMYTIPAVALDGTPSGLSADGRTLALIRPRARFPQRRTRLALLDGRGLQVRERVALRGDFSFDALSPDGRTMYLIEYLSRRDPTRYAVRAYDVLAGRLLRAPIVDPREPDERMRGLPITRETSPDGRWEYTLYDGAGSYPFVHALDTVRGEAACIDLDALTGFLRLYELRLRVAGGELRVLDGKEPVAVIDPETLTVGSPAAPARARPAAAPAPSSEDAATWALLAGGAALPLLTAGAALAVRRRRAARAHTAGLSPVRRA